MSFTLYQKTVAKAACLLEQLKELAPLCLAFLTRHETPYIPNEDHAVLGSSDEEVSTLHDRYEPGCRLRCCFELEMRQ
jgi:hypothetical protein